MSSFFFFFYCQWDKAGLDLLWMDCDAHSSVFWAVPNPPIGPKSTKGVHHVDEAGKWWYSRSVTLVALTPS